MGEANIKDIATLIGTFFFNNLFDTGITAQSQAGKKNPKKIPVIVARILFLGINPAIFSFGIYTSEMVKFQRK